MLDSISYSNQTVELKPLSASGNNRVFSLQTHNQNFVLKWYFHDEEDTRDRLGVEYSFLEHAWKIGLRSIPQPFAKDSINHIALYEFVDGVKLSPQDISLNHIEQAAEFFADLNSNDSHEKALNLHTASEACFSFAEHFEMVHKRLDRFKYIQIKDDIDRSATVFIKDLVTTWQRLQDHLLKRILSIGLDLRSSLNRNQRCISPSDFGFHNALLRDNGSLCFIDFEYAGWDDPAKAIGDFFSHPGVPVSHEYFDLFLNRALQPYRDTIDEMEVRVRLIEPVFKVKWCCIVLNEFLLSEARRRNFANPTNDIEQRKKIQLVKAQKIFNSIQFNFRE